MSLARSTNESASARYVFDSQYIGGAWIQGTSASIAAVTSPWSGEVLARLGRADAADVDRAFEASKAQQLSWAAMLPVERATVFRRAAEIMEQRREEIVELLIDEVGSVRSKAEIEWWAVHASILEASTLPSRVEGRILPGDYPGKDNYIYRLPAGVVAVISPWNWPMHLSMRSVAPALALGNGVVIKPSEATPITGGLLIARIFEEAGLPPGLLNVVVGSSAEIGDYFVGHPISRVVSFTGSTAVGRHVGRLCVESSMLKRAMLELGGNAPLIVTEDVDLEFAVHLAVVGKFFHSGQMCIAINRIIVAAEIHDAFVDRFVDRVSALSMTDRYSTQTAIGPVINRSQLDKLLKMSEDAKSEGARQRLGGEPRGLVLPPQVFDNVTQSMAIARREIFGPIAIILKAKDDADAIAMANDTDFGLASGVVCRDYGRALRIARQIDAGMTHINDIPAIDMPSMPFGGEKNSGTGRFGSHDIIDEFTTEHWVSNQSGQSAYPF